MSSSSRRVSSTRPTSSSLSSQTKIMFRLAARNFAARNIASGSVVAPRFALAARSRIVPCAAFSAAAGLSKEEITARVLQVLRSFEKVKADKVRTAGEYLVCRRANTVLRQLNPTASFSDDLGLDSLDAVEVVMAVEEVRSYSHLSEFLIANVTPGVCY